jgi:hypothetical protein
VLQIICRQYIKNNPEFLEKKKDNLKDAEPRIENPRFPGHGGAMVEFSGVSIKVIAQVVIKFLADNGLLAGLFTSTGVVLSKIPTSAIEIYLRDSFAQNLPQLEKKSLF